MPLLHLERSIRTCGDEGASGYQRLLAADAWRSARLCPSAAVGGGADVDGRDRRVAVRLSIWPSLCGNRAQLEDFLAEPITCTLDVNLDTAGRFGTIAGALRRKGRPIPTNDIWIAAHAVQAGAELLSYDAHFEAVEGLSRTHLTVARA